MPSLTGRSMGETPVRRRRQRRPGGHRWWRRILLLTTAGLLTILVGTGTLLYTYAGELPSLDHLSAQSLPQTTRIYARDGVTLLEERYQQRRTVVALNNVAWDLRHATIAIEDRDFYNHGAVNPVRMLAAGVYDILPQRPSDLNPFLPEGFAHARGRQRDVLDAMVRDGYITAAVADKAYQEDLRPMLTAAHQAAFGQRASLAPHFVDYVWNELEQRYDPGYLLRGGLRIVTTLDPKAQALAQQAVHDGVGRYARSNRVNNGAMLVMNPHTGEVLAMVGSADYYNNDIGGQVNYTVAPRQPGSSFKPYTYVTALMNGWTPASPLEDSNGARAFPGYPVHDWDNKELGTITLRQSLQQSRNISSVHLFKDVGIQKVFTTARELGISTPLDRSEEHTSEL